MDSSTEFLKENNIFHSLTAPGYPATNGLVEHYVEEEFKDELDKIGNTSETLQTTLDRVLLMNRITPTASVKSLFQLLMNRETRLRFSALRAKVSKLVVKIFQDNHDHHPTLKSNHLSVIVINGFQEHSENSQCQGFRSQNRRH